VKSRPLTYTYSFLVASLLFLLPSNLFAKFFVESGYIHGLLIDYLLPKLYLSDLVVGSIFLVWLGNVFSKEAPRILFKKVTVKATAVIQNNWLLSALVLLVALSPVWSNQPLASFWYLAKILEMLWLGWFLASHTRYFKKYFLVAGVLVTVAFQLTLGLYQIIQQHSWAGYYFLGEPHQFSQLGMAKTVWQGRELVLAYGTTAHPNILAGMFTLYLLLFLRFLQQEVTAQPKIPKAWVIAGVVASFFAEAAVLMITGSFSAALSFLVGVLILLFLPRIKKECSHRPVQAASVLGASILTILFAAPVLIFALAQLDPSNLSLTRRMYLHEAAFEMWLQQPIFGVGLNAFTTELDTLLPTQFGRSFIQPVHHVGLLILAETGVVGVGSLIAVILHSVRYWLRRQPQLLLTQIVWLLPLLPLATLDHYLLSQQTGLLLLVIWSTGIFFRLEKN